MSYIEKIMSRIADLTDGLDETLLGLYALLALTKGEDTSLEDVHDAWAAWRVQTRPDHPSLIPFDQLTPEVQELDRPYMDAIRVVAREIATTGSES